MRLDGESEDCIGTADRVALGTKGAAVADKGVESLEEDPCGAVGFCGRLGWRSPVGLFAKDARRGREECAGGVIGSGEA